MDYYPVVHFIISYIHWISSTFSWWYQCIPCRWPLVMAQVAVAARGTGGVVVSPRARWTFSWEDFPALRAPAREAPGKHQKLAYMIYKSSEIYVSMYDIYIYIYLCVWYIYIWNASAMVTWVNSESGSLAPVVVGELGPHVYLVGARNWNGQATLGSGVVRPMVR